MSHLDLPDDWPIRSLHDPVLAADLIDLFIGPTDRSRGPGLGFLLCRRGGQLAQPVSVGELGGRGEARRVIEGMADTALDLGFVTGFVLAIVRPCGPVGDLDRSVHQHALDVCRSRDLVLYGTFLATGEGIAHLPVAPELSQHRPGAA